MDDRQYVSGGDRAGLRRSHPPAASERVRLCRERWHALAAASSKAGDRRGRQDPADSTVDVAEARHDPGKPPPHPRGGAARGDDRSRLHAEPEDPDRRQDRHRGVRRLGRQGQRRSQQARVPQLVRLVRPAGRQHGPHRADRHGDLHVRLFEIALRALSEPGRRDDPADPRANPRAEQMSVRAMALPRPATPLHDRPAPRRWTQIDPILLIVTLLLIGYGLVMTYSTTAETRTFTGDPMQFVIRGAIWAAVGMAAMAAIALFDYAWLGAFAPLLYVFTRALLEDCQRARLSAFLDPYADPQGAGWNIIQSLIAVGSGGATGKGLTAGTQSPLGYLPIAESDFVFSGLAEDLGFAGAVILFALYIVLLIAALRVALRAKDPFGMLVGAGIATMLLFQIMVNVGMAISLMPVTGIPLPFISHGGSSLVSICFALGVLQSISMRREPEGP